MDAPHGRWLNGWRKSLTATTRRMLLTILNKSQRQHPTKQQLYSHLTPITETINVRRTRHAGHCWRSRDKLISDVHLWTPSHGQAKQGDQLEPTYSSSVRIRDVTPRTCQKLWTIRRSGKRGSGISVLVAGQDDIYIYIYIFHKCQYQGIYLGQISSF